MDTNPSGTQHTISFHEQRAVIVEVGGGLREYRVGDAHVLEAYAKDAICDGAHGALLAPWPNRIAKGRYEFNGKSYQLPITEPELGNAIHGLVRWRPWSLAGRSDSSVSLTTRIHPQPGYPFTVDLATEYRLNDDGLTVRTSFTNLSSGPCPFGVGHHPYLSGGPEGIDSCYLQVPALKYLESDRQSMLPVGSPRATHGSAVDFTKPRLVGNQILDTCFSELERDESGLAWIHLVDPTGSRRSLWADRSWKFLQVFTGDTLPPLRRRTGLAVEPMSCVPDAFNSSPGEVLLEPGRTITMRWGLQHQ